MEEHLDDLRKQLNTDALPSDVKVFSLLPVSNRFNAKNCVSFREYSYYLPTFMLTPLSKLYLATPPRELTTEERKEEETKAEVVTQVTSGVKKIIRQPGVEDEHELEGALHANRNIDHITSDRIDEMYKTRLCDEVKTQLHELWSSFTGTKKYHNFTKDVKPHENQAARYMMRMTANEFMYVNRETFAVTDEADENAIEFVRFYLQGQSFLFNQIRKMVGSMIQVFHGELGPSFVSNAHKDNSLNVTLSPGDGLLLERVAYDKYNSLSSTQ